MQNLLILFPALLIVGLLIYDYCDPKAWHDLKDSSAAPIPLKIVLGMQWAHIPLWHWALLVVEVSGILMLFIAGNACSHRRSGNWDEYSRGGMKRDLLLMNNLTRLRNAAALVFMLCGLGMCLVSFKEWQKYLPDPLLHRLERFYKTQELREVQRLDKRAKDAKKLPDFLLKRLDGFYQIQEPSESVRLDKPAAETKVDNSTPGIGRAVGPPE